MLFFDSVLTVKIDPNGNIGTTDHYPDPTCTRPTDIEIAECALQIRNKLDADGVSL